MFLKTKLVVLGMLLALMTLLSIGTHSLLGDESGGKKKCPDKIFAEIQCPKEFVPICFGAPEIVCPNLEGAAFHFDRFAHPIPEFQQYQEKQGYQPLSPPTQTVCYILCDCKPFYMFGLYVACLPDLDTEKARFASPSYQGTRCPQ